MIFFLLLLLVPVAHGQSTVVINELQAANHGAVTDDRGDTPDWIELYNPTRSAIRLTGMRLAINGRQHVIDAPLSVPGRGHLLLWCDAHPQRGADHTGFTLPRDGGAVLLIAADGTTIMDLFTYPKLPSNTSIGRLPDGAKTWSLLERPTPSAANSMPGMVVVHERCATPEFDPSAGVLTAPCVVTLNAAEGVLVRYTLDGTRPTEEHGMSYDAPFMISENTVLRAVAFRAGSLPSDELCAAYLIEGGKGLSLSLAPEDLWEDSTGIYIDGRFANHSRSGIAWERPGHAQWPDGNVEAVGVRISGSGSRGLAKRSFKLYARDRYASSPDGFQFPDGTRSDEAMLRADGSPHAFLRNRFMETVVRTYGLHVAMQPSVPVPLYLNASYWGLYRWMPSKDEQWLAQQAGVEALDVLEGPAGVALSGSDKHFRAALDLLLNKAPIDSIDAVIDTQSLIDLACIDLFTGRGDHDLNVRCYRPRQTGGRWRWVLFDMDLWAPAEENSVERMCSAAAPETPFIPQLIAHPDLQRRLLARLTALGATAFAPRSSRAIADSLFAAHKDDLNADHARWATELERPDPTASATALAEFLGERPRHLMDYVSERTGRGVRTVSIEAPSTDRGHLLLEGLPLSPGRHEIMCFSGIPVHVEFRSATEHELVGWKGFEGNAAAMDVDLSRIGRLAPRVVTVAP